MIRKIRSLGFSKCNNFQPKSEKNIAIRRLICTTFSKLNCCSGVHNMINIFYHIISYECCSKTKGNQSGRCQQSKIMWIREKWIFRTFHGFSWQMSCYKLFIFLFLIFTEFATPFSEGLCKIGKSISHICGTAQIHQFCFGLAHPVPILRIPYMKKKH